MYIIHSRRPRAGRFMTSVAGLDRCHVSGWLLQGILREIGAAMTGGTRLGLHGRLGVVHGRRRPIDIAALVAGIALLGDLDVGRRHGQRILAGIGRVVTGRTQANRQHMVHLGRFEGIEVLVAVRTLLAARRDMTGRQAQRSCSVMAGGALAISRGIMNEGNRRPGGGRAMTSVTLRRSRHMGRRLGQRI